MPRFIGVADKGSLINRGEGKALVSTGKGSGPHLGKDRQALGNKERSSSHPREKGTGKEKRLHAKEKNISGSKDKGGILKEKGSLNIRENIVKEDGIVNKEKGIGSNLQLAIKTSTHSMNALATHTAINTSLLDAATFSLHNDTFWNPPLWLTREKHAPRARSLVIPIPPVPAATRKAIQQMIAKHQRPRFKQHEQVQQLQNKIKCHKDKVRIAQQKLDKLEGDKAERIQEIKGLREEEIQKSLKKIEEEAMKNLEEVLKVQEDEWQQRIEKEMKAAKRQFKKDQAEKDELERESHKQNFEEQNKIARAGLKRKESVEDGEVDDAEGAEDADKPLPSEQLEKKHGKIKQELQNLKETKKEMVWLLKQVINAEKKRKVSQSAMSKKKQVKLN